MLRTRQLIPPITIRTPDGHTVRAWDFKQKKNLVIVFLDVACGPCEEFLQLFVDRAAALREREAVTLAVFLEPVPIALTQGLPQEIVAGSDISGHSTRRFLGDDAISAKARGGRGVFVTDRYGELSAFWVAQQHEFPGIEEIFKSLDHIQIACEECFMPHWPAET
jgi:hypothetical protein